MSDQTETTASDWCGFQQALADSGQRRMVLVEGERQVAVARVAGLLQALSSAEGIWVGREQDAARAGLGHLRVKDYRRVLGRELPVLVWDGWEGTSPDAFAALSGTLRAGGLLFWLMPPLAKWSDFDDPDYGRTGLDRTSAHPFAARLAAILAEDPDVIRLAAADVTVTELNLTEPVRTGFQPGQTAEQQALVADIVRTGQGRRRRPLVVTADRGRGKSAALGIAAARLLESGRKRVLVTAPAAENVATLFGHARQELGDALALDTPTHLTTRSGHELCFLPPQELLSQRPAAEVIMVDEAAGLPAQWLKAMLLGWPRVVFASTVHGYEGTGRGFALRFRQVLEQETPHWRAVSVREPIRWAEGDPLERLIFQLYLLSADAPEPESVVTGDVHIERWQPAAASEQALAEAFGLLVNAHYRTTPGDLRQWLDDPAALTWRASVKGQTIGVLWASTEGGLAPELADEVVAGKRRLRGHLLAQSLANHGGMPAAATLKTLRVVRVAVAESARRLGVGQRLVAAAREACVQGGIDALGTSFGGESGLLAFWRRCGLRVVRMGLSQEASTGEFPLQMLTGTSEPGLRLQHQLGNRFARHWLALVPRHWPQLDHELLLSVSEALPSQTGLDDDDRRDLTHFAYGFRGFELTLPVLQGLSVCKGMPERIQSHPEAVLWCRAVLQGWSWAQLQDAGLCRGQRDAETQLRLLTRELLQNEAEL